MYCKKGSGWESRLIALRPIYCMHIASLNPMEPSCKASALLLGTRICSRE